jgi:hypothetical protein
MGYTMHISWSAIIASEIIKVSTIDSSRVRRLPAGRAVCVPPAAWGLFNFYERAA